MLFLMVSCCSSILWPRTNLRVVLIQSQGSGFIAHQLSNGVAHTLSAVWAGGGPPACTCLAGQRGTGCEPVAKVFLLTGATEKQLMQYLGMQMGSRHGLT